MDKNKLVDRFYSDEKHKPAKPNSHFRYGSWSVINFAEFMKDHPFPGYTGWEAMKWELTKDDILLRADTWEELENEINKTP